MKRIGYLIFAFFFGIGNLFPQKKNKVLLWNGHNFGLNGNLLALKEELEKRNKKKQFSFFCKKEIFSKKGFLGKVRAVLTFFVVLPFHMATASQIFLNDNFMPLAYCKVKKNVQVIQLWHGAGAFKKFGLSVENNEKISAIVKKANEKVTHLFVTSQKVMPFYEDAFSIDSSRIYITGIPITDIYYQSQIMEQRKVEFYKKYPELKNKKIALYTPTFRKTQEENNSIMEHFDVKKIKEALGENWVILVKFHPKYPVENIPENSFCYNFSDYIQISDLYFVSDMLITDYSSTVVEYVLLNKPVVLYAYDLEEYDRGFYRDYRQTVPGKIARNQQELLEILSKKEDEIEKRQTFVKLQYDYNDDCSSERIVKILEETK